MKTRIRDVDFARVIAQAEEHFDATGEACYPEIQAELEKKRTTRAQLTMLRDFTALAAVFEATSPDEISAESPLMRAFSAVQQRLGTPIPRVPLRSGLDAAERISVLARERMSAWDPERFLADVIEAIKQSGDGEVDDSQLPWRSNWGRAQPAVLVLFLFAALRKAGVFDTYSAETDEARRRREKLDLVDSVGGLTPKRGTYEAPRGMIDRDSLRAHDEWVRRKREGSGQLDVTGADASGSDFHGTLLVAARLSRVNLRKAAFDYANLTEAELAHCDLELAGINSTHFDNARISDCNFADALGEIVKFDGATVSGARFDRAKLRVSQWSGANVTATSFASSLLGNAAFDRARFVDCDFRGAYLGASSENPAPSMQGATFVNCDFRDADFTRAKLDGATFDRCKFAGAHGEPRSSVGTVVTDADIGGCDQLIAALQDSLSVAQILEHAGPLVAARDSADPLRTAVFVVGKGARLLGRVPLTDALDRLPKGATYGQSGVVWAWDDDTFTVWNSEQKALEARGDSLSYPGGPLDRTLVTRVSSFINPGRLGNRGVRLIMPRDKYGGLVVVQDNDFGADDNPAYTREDARRDGMWASHLGRYLAAWLGVPQDDEFTG